MCTQLVAPPLPPTPAEPEKPAKGGKKEPPPPPPVDEAPLEPSKPATHWSIAYSDEFAPVAGEHTKPASPEYEAWKEKDLSQPLEFRFEYGAPCAFRHAEGHAALERLLNTDVQLRLHDSASGAVLAEIKLDMLPFALGKQCFDIEGVVLQPSEQPEAASATPVCNKVRIHSCVQM